MKLKVQKDDLINVLQNVQSIVSSRSTLPILSNILFETGDGELSITATDIDVSVRTRVRAEVEEEGSTTLPARRAFSIFRELPAGVIELDVDADHTATIRAASSFFKLNGMDATEFPPLPVFESETSYTLDEVVFREMLQKTSYAASTDETRYILNGCLLSFRDDKLTCVATDGRRLALVEQEVEFPKTAEGEMVVPSKTVNELIRTLGDAGTLTIRAMENQIAFEFDNMLIVSKLIDGTYPNFRQVIPASSEVRVELDREDLQAAVRRAALLTTAQSNSVRLNLMKNRLEVVTRTPDVGEACETVTLKYDGKDVSVAFNPEYLLAPLKTLQSDVVYFEVTDELSPGVLKADVPFLYVIMPMRIS